LALFVPAALDLLILALHLLIPARWTDGYVRDAAGRPLRYRLNGLRVFLIVIGLYALACSQGWMEADYFYVHRWAMAAGACTVGLLFTLVLVFTAPPTPGTGLLADLYLGRRENPQWGGGRVDAKMYLYLAGAIGLELNLLSCAAHHLRVRADDPSPSVILYTVLFTFFLAEYLFFERVHLYTYDFVAERVGFKLGWGCLVFYPYFYAVGLGSTAEMANPHAPVWQLALCALCFFTGWFFARGANLQKYLFKLRPEARLLGLLTPVALEGDGRRLLCSGFWGLSRHVNYLGELLMAVGLTLALGHPTAVGPWLYPLYYLGLLIPRQAADDRRCAAKYGVLWQEYCRRVPYRIIPFVY
jgi:protein-S-isoprenylcysteine O-methyltransferase Ste14